VVDFGLRSWVLGLRDYFFICDHLRVSAVNQLKGGVCKTLEPLNPRSLGPLPVNRGINLSTQICNFI